MKLNNEQIEQSIKSALENTSTNNFEAIKKAAHESKGVVVPMKNKKRWIKIVAVVAAFAIIFGGGYGVVRHQTAKKAITTVSLDVNPSIDLSLNKYNEILSATALNNDASSILDGLDLEGLDLDVGVDKIMESLISNNYISSDQNSILVTVESQKDSIAEKIQDTLTSQIESKIKESISMDGNVLSQIIPSSMDTTNLEKIAEQYGISVGKANFIEQIIGSASDLDISELASKTINEISLIATAKGADIKDTIIQQGTASVEKYINENAAQLIALGTEGISNVKLDGLKITKSDFTYNNGVMCYDIGFEYQNEAFLIEVDASTGAVIDKETGKIGVELEIKDVNVEVNTGNDAVDNVVNGVANEIIDQNVNGKKITGEVSSPDVNTNDDGSVDVKTDVDVGGIDIPVEVTLDEATIKSIKDTAKTVAIEPVMAILKSNSITSMAVSILGEDTIRTLIGNAIDDATVNTVEINDKTYYKVSTSISVLSINQGINIYLTQDMNLYNVELA